MMKIASVRYLVAMLSLCLLAPAMSWAGTSRAAADTLGQVRVVPNPWSASIESQQYAGRSGDSVNDARDGYSRVWFMGIPPTCTIKLYTVDGDLIRTIRHEPVGDVESTQEKWDLIADSDQYAVSGIYVFVVQSDAGTSVGKFIIIR